MHCYDLGTLRTYLDRALPDAETRQVETHLAHCEACREQLNQLREQAAQVARLLDVGPLPDPHAAFARLRSTVQMPASAPSHRTKQPLRRFEMVRSQWLSPRRGWLAAAATLVVLLGLLALPPVRAAADQLLQIFRVQQIVFVPISTERIEELRDLNIDPSSLFVGEPEVIGTPSEPREVASIDEASAAAGFSVAQINGAGTPQIFVQDSRNLRFQVNLEGAQNLLDMLGITDVTLPSELGSAPIEVESKAMVMQSYKQGDVELNLLQTQSPNVTLPDGVDLAQLGEAGLRVLGLSAEEAAQFSEQIDWSSTLVLPFPSDITSLSQVRIGSQTGMVFGDDEAGRTLYWQDNGYLYVLVGDTSVEALIAAAESVR